MTDSGAPPRALAGLQVVDMTQALAGPYLGLLLGDLGADVIKVERPDVGDQARGWGPPFVGSESAYFMAVNRNKRSLTCDIKTPQGREVLRRLLDRADVVISNERRQSYRVRMGMDYESLAQRNPGVVYCSITGFGMTGPYAGRGGYDIIAQGMSGLMSIAGMPDDPPLRVPASIADMCTAMYGLSSVLAALYVRQSSGHGQYIDLSLLESHAWWGVIQAASYLANGTTPRKYGNDHQTIVPYSTFKAQDGHIIIACGSETLWQALCRLLHLEEIQDDPRYATNRERVIRRDEVRQLIEDKLAEKPVAAWYELLRAEDIPCGPIYTIPEMLEDPQMQARGFVVSQEHPVAGTLRTLASPVRLAATPADYRLPPPLLGQHTDEVLAELGFAPAEIAAMRADKAV
jgi:crotonobetainyl-CoA:carnitine CoA-transferase CaiB-like acyl-CoA transferase